MLQSSVASKLLFLCLAASLACFATVTASKMIFDKEAWVPFHYQEHEAYQAGYSKELPSCGDNFFSLAAVEKEAACFDTLIRLNASELDCLPECVESWRFNGVECETELINLQVKLADPIIEAAKNGTMKKKERDLVEAMLLQVGINGTAPGFLSTEEKAKEFFSSKENLEELTYFWPSQEEADEYVTDHKMFDRAGCRCCQSIHDQQRIIFSECWIPAHVSCIDSSFGLLEVDRNANSDWLIHPARYVSCRLDPV